MNAREQLLDAATWHADEADRLRCDLETMTPGHRDAIGPAQVHRMEVDAETHQELADEYRAHVERAYPADEHQADQASLF